jgi:CRP/FNR family cyclic AMP-dependent transcriptional regulator
MKPLVQDIAEHPFLQGMSARHSSLIAEFAMETQFSRDQIVFREHDPANRFYLLRCGRVALESPRKQGKSEIVQIITGGDVLGWSWLFPPYYWHFDARALEPTSAIFFYGTPLRELCDQDHAFGYDLLKRVAAVAIARLQKAREQLLLSRTCLNAKPETVRLSAN